jgi:putative endonuclease
MMRSGTKKEKGDQSENAALVYLERQGLKLVQRNYQRSRGPSMPAGEIDLIMRDPHDGTLVFVEVRDRSGRVHGGAAASVTPAKQRRLVYAAQNYLSAWASPPPCRFDVVAIEHGQLQWLRSAFNLAR